MKTINEQIQRLRDILVTCYKVIAEKGGTVPEVGERNMTNLPAAVQSVPQVVGAELEELTITENGIYTPSDGVDGFSKVTAEFDTSGPKVKVSQFKVTNACINNDGIWEGAALIDTSNVTSFSDIFPRRSSKLKEMDVSNWDTSNATTMNSIFRDCYGLLYLDVSNWDTRNVINMSSVFHDCVSLRFLDVSKWDVSNVTNMNSMFRSVISLESLDLTKWDVSNVTNIDYMLYDNRNVLRSIIGGRTIDDVLANNIGCLNGLKVSAPYMFAYTRNLDRASLRAVINGLADLTGQATQTLTIGATLLAKLTAEDIAVATAKNWNLS